MARIGAGWTEGRLGQLRGLTPSAWWLMASPLPSRSAAPAPCRAVGVILVTGAVMEATGIYWEKAYDVLSQAGLDVMVVHAQHVKQIKHRKTDIADSVWLSRICQIGLASPSLILPKTFRDLRGLSRYRRTLIEQRAQNQVRIQKVLDRNGIRIGGILSRITPSVNGRRIIEGLVASASRETILSRLSWHVRK